MTTLRRILTTSALAVMACGLASANSIIVTCSTAGPGGTDLGPNPPTQGHTNGSISCGGADLGAGYVLTSAALTITGSVLDTEAFPSQALLTNNNTGTETFTFATTDTFSVDATSPNSLANFSGLAPASLFTTFASTGLTSLGAGASNTYFLSGSQNGSGTDTNGTDLANWLGLTGFSFILDTTTGSSISGGGGEIGFSQQTFVEATASVDYTYTTAATTPEPTTMALLGGALVGLGLLGKRAKKNS